MPEKFAMKSHPAQPKYLNMAAILLEFAKRGLVKSRLLESFHLKSVLRLLWINYS
jgi:hypothetical protein